MSAHRRRLETALAALMRRKLWAQARDFCAEHQAVLAQTSLHWAARHVGECAALPPGAQHPHLSARPQIEARLRQTAPGLALESAKVVEEGFIALCCLRLRVRDRTSGQRRRLFEKIYPAYRTALTQHETRLFQQVPAEMLLAPALLGQWAGPGMVALLYENAGENPPRGWDRAMFNRIRQRHWQAVLPVRLRAKRLLAPRGLLDPAGLARQAGALAGPALDAALERLPALAERIEAMPQFPLHMDLKAANVLVADPARGETLDNLRVVDWEKWKPAPVGAGLRLLSEDLADPAFRRALEQQLAEAHPLAPLVAALFALNQRPAPGPEQARSWLGLITARLGTDQ